MKFCDILKRKEFVVTCEFCPPKGTDLTEMLQKTELVRPYVDAINVTDNQRARLYPSSLAVSRILKERGFEVICHLTCRDRNRLSLQSDLLGVHILGIENILFLSGDHPLLGDHPESKPVYDLDVSQLLRTANHLKEGKTLSGKKLQNKISLCTGAVVNPEAEPQELQILMMEKKIVLGAEFFQTQPVFDVDKYRKFYDRVKGFGARVLPSVLVIKSAKFAKNMSKVPGIKIPEKYIKRLERAQNPLKEGLKIADEIILALKEFSGGIHIMAPGIEENIPQLKI